MVLEQAVPQITTVGTKQRPIIVRNLKNNGSPISELTVPSSINIENGAPTSYSKIITGKASAYTGNVVPLRKYTVCCSFANEQS